MYLMYQHIYLYININICACALQCDFAAASTCHEMELFRNGILSLCMSTESALANNALQMSKVCWYFLCLTVDDARLWPWHLHSPRQYRCRTSRYASPTLNSSSDCHKLLLRRGFKICGGVNSRTHRFLMLNLGSLRLPALLCIAATHSDWLTAPKKALKPLKSSKSAYSGSTIKQGMMRGITCSLSRTCNILQLACI